MTAPRYRQRFFRPSDRWVRREGDFNSIYSNNHATNHFTDTLIFIVISIVPPCFLFMRGKAPCKKYVPPGGVGGKEKARGVFPQKGGSQGEDKNEGVGVS